MSIKFEGLDDFMLTMEQIAQIPDLVLNKMVSAGGRVLKEAIVDMGYAMGVYDTRTTLDAATLGRPRTTPSGGKKIFVTFNGTNEDGNRNAEVAFVNEYGRHATKPYPGRPFVSAGTLAAADNATAKAAEIYDNWLDSLD